MNYKAVFSCLALMAVISCDSGTGHEKSKTSQDVADKSSSSIEIPVSSSETPESSEMVKSSEEYVSSSSSDENSSANLLKTTNIILYDKGGLIGKTTSVTAYGISVYSNKGYFYSIDWKGIISDNQLYYSDSNCVGKIYSIAVGIAIYAKNVFYSKRQDKIYIGKDTLNDGTLFYSSDSIKTSSRSYQDSCYNHKIQFTTQSTELKPVTKKDVGIPEKITPPLRIEFE